MGIRISIDWQGKKGLDSLIRYIENNTLYGEMQIETQILAHHAADNMKEIISTSKKRPSFGSNLEDNILAEPISTTGGIEYGIGRISHLKTNAPYFEVLDVGGYVPYSTAKGAPLGSFEGFPPDQLGGNQNWERSGNKGFFMKPSKAIEGIDYIGKAIRNLDQELRITMEKLGTKLIEDMQKESNGISGHGKAIPGLASKANVHLGYTGWGGFQHLK